MGLDREPEDGRQLADASASSCSAPTASPRARSSTSSSRSPSRPPPGQNPTTRAIAGLKVHTVTDGDSLQSVAYQNYGDATRWRKIAEANGIDNPFALRRGSQLTIPTIDT